MQNIQTTIDEKINPLLQLHSGGCKAVSFNGGVLKLNLHGGCAGCPSAKITLFNMIIPILKENHSDIDDVILV